MSDHSCRHLDKYITKALGEVNDEEEKKKGAVKSTAVVKYSRVETPANFNQLLPETNLNEPPAKWLHGMTKWQQHLKELSLGNLKQFTSFKMAHSYPDLTGEIDVISDAENIKKLLKIPFNKGGISMMVHRVGNTLLLDDFDIHRHLLRREADDWRWLRKFYYDIVLRNMQDNAKESIILKKNKSRDHLQDKNMFSKFLYYSAGDNECESSSVKLSQDGISSDDHLETLPDPLPQLEFMKTQSDHQRMVVWTFEDIRMLIGSDLPIFGGGTYPCVSLKLRDMEKPINVLTGLDYWLDNLMCNVPELAMCYHLNGIVQSYELLKTEDIPNLDNSRFSPKLVKDIAQNILSFLHSNATKEGHTYWLFKGHDDDVIKLYDLSTLCTENMEEDENNPFSVPVGILLYRVARNMRQTMGRKKSGTIRTLLQNALQLLDIQVHSQIVTSAHFLLSDLYMTDNIYNSEDNPTPDDSDTEEESESATPSESDNEEPRSSSSVPVQALCLTGQLKKTEGLTEMIRHPPITGDSEERSRYAIKHIAEGLLCLEESAKKSQATSKHQVDDQAQCNPAHAIPLHYSPLVNPSCKTNSELQPFDLIDSPEKPSKNLPHHTWHCLSKVLLLRKAAVTYLCLSECKVAKMKLGQALKYVQAGLLCFASMRQLSETKARENEAIQAALFALCADINIILVHQGESNLEAHREDFTFHFDDDQTISTIAYRDLENFEHKWLTDFTSGIKHNLDKGIFAYELAINISERCPTPATRKLHIKKCYGNALNELGVWCMNQATQNLRPPSATCGKLPDTSLSYCKQSQECFERGIEVFTSIKDKVNAALLTSNIGRLMRVVAQCNIPYNKEGLRLEFSEKEKTHYQKALYYYKSAVRLLEKRSFQPQVWDSVNWELSSTYFSMATTMQDFAPLTSKHKNEVEHEITELMNKALNHCDTETNSPRQPTCQYRAGTIHHRLASLYHNAIRNQSTTDQRKKHLRSLAELHYTKAVQCFSQVESPCEQLRVQLEMFALLEYHVQQAPSSNAQKMKNLHLALMQLLKCDTSLVQLVNNLEEAASEKQKLASASSSHTANQSSSVDGSTSEELKNLSEEGEKLLSILQSRFESVLLTLVKSSNMASNTTNKKSKLSKVLHTYKTMYATYLKTVSKSTEEVLLRCKTILKAIHLMRESAKQIDF